MRESDKRDTGKFDSDRLDKPTPNEWKHLNKDMYITFWEIAQCMHKVMLVLTSTRSSAAAPEIESSQRVKRLNTTGPALIKNTVVMNARNRKVSVTRIMAYAGGRTSAMAGAQMRADMEALAARLTQKEQALLGAGLRMSAVPNATPLVDIRMIGKAPTSVGEHKDWLEW